LARALGTVGHLSALRRIQNGAFSLEQSFDQVQLRAAAQGDEGLRQAARAALVPLVEVARKLSHVTLSEEGARHAFHGRPVPSSEVLNEICLPEHEGDVRVAFDASGKVLALVEPDPSGSGLRVVRGIRAP
jgi:tRNA U55 pseudouridine synthase TruB